MNQILYVGENKGNGPIAIKSIVKFFAIVIIAFGIILIGKGSYAIYKNIEINSGDNIPVVYMNRVNNTVVIKAEDNIEISKLIYSWNKGEETILLPNSKKVEEVVLLPNENSVLNVTIVDTKGKETKFMQEWNIEGTDIRKPEIEITTDEDIRKITIIARDETEINYLIYKWNEEEEIKINATENDKLKIQETIDMILGENKLTVTINDEVGIKKVTLNINGQTYGGNYSGKKQLKLNVPLKKGNNTISITAINESDLEQKVVREFTYKQ